MLKVALASNTPRESQTHLLPVSTVYINGEVFHVLAPAQAAADFSRWRDQFQVRWTSSILFESYAIDFYRKVAINATIDELNRAGAGLLYQTAQPALP